MKVIQLAVRASRDHEVVLATIVAQRNEGGSWKEVERHTVRSDEPNMRKLLLEDNERIIIEGKTQTELVMVDNTVFERPAAVPPGPPVVTTQIAGPLPSGTESQIGVWREADEQDWSRTGKRYRTY